jgi:transcriptional regulator with XRE-family HTH domain
MATTLQKTRKKYGLSQEALAGMLGISRPTLAKVESGERDLTQIEKEKLDKIVESFELENQDHALRINIPQNNEAKFKQVLLYILEKVGAKPNVGLTVLYKLLYFIDFDYYEKYGKQLMGLTYFKNTHGPTPRHFSKIVNAMKKSGELEGVRSKYFAHEQKKFLPRIEPNMSSFNGDELEVMDDVLRRYSDKTGLQLSDISHRDMPWKATDMGKDIEYELAFYRHDEFSVGEYDPL